MEIPKHPLFKTTCFRLVIAEQIFRYLEDEQIYVMYINQTPVQMHWNPQRYQECSSQK